MNCYNCKFFKDNMTEGVYVYTCKLRGSNDFKIIEDDDECELITSQYVVKTDIPTIDAKAGDVLIKEPRKKLLFTEDDFYDFILHYALYYGYTPSYRTIEHKFGCCTYTVKSYVDKLCKRGLLTKRKGTNSIIVNELVYVRKRDLAQKK